MDFSTEISIEAHLHWYTLATRSKLKSALCIIRKLNLIEFRFPIFLTLRAIEPTRLSNCTNFRLCICSIHSLLMAPVLFALRVLHGIQTWKIAQFVAIIR